MDQMSSEFQPTFLQTTMRRTLLLHTVDSRSTIKGFLLQITENASATCQQKISTGLPHKKNHREQNLASIDLFLSIHSYLDGPFGNIT